MVRTVLKSAVSATGSTATATRWETKSVASGDGVWSDIVVGPEGGFRCIVTTHKDPIDPRKNYPGGAMGPWMCSMVHGAVREAVDVERELHEVNKRLWSPMAIPTQRHPGVNCAVVDVGDLVAGSFGATPKKRKRRRKKRSNDVVASTDGRGIFDFPDEVRGDEAALLKSWGCGDVFVYAHVQHPNTSYGQWVEVFSGDALTFHGRSAFERGRGLQHPADEAQPRRDIEHLLLDNVDWWDRTPVGRFKTLRLHAHMLAGVTDAVISSHPLSLGPQTDTATIETLIGTQAAAYDGFAAVLLRGQ